MNFDVAYSSRQRLVKINLVGEEHQQAREMNFDVAYLCFVGNCYPLKIFEGIVEARFIATFAASTKDAMNRVSTVAMSRTH
jgi:hypothetical protein